MALVGAALLLAGPARAGSYLDRAAILLEGATRELDMLEGRTGDKETVAVIHALAETRARAARRMEVPAAVTRAHPHLLLVLENCERASEAAAEGNTSKFLERLQTARDEDRSFRAALGKLGYTLPHVGR